MTSPLAAQEPTQSAHSEIPETQVVEVVAGTDLLAALSPDGRRAAFLLLGQPWVVERRAGPAQALGAELEPTQYFGLAWASDSRRLAAWYWEGDPERRGIRVFDTRTGKEQSYPEPRDLLGLQWAPGGDAVLFGTAGEDSTDLWRLEVGSGATRRLARVPGSARDVTFSPDLRNVAYDVSRGEPSAQGLWEVALPSGAARRVVVDTLAPSQPRYSPDGSHIAFLAEVDGAKQPWVVNLVGGPPRPIAHSPQNVPDAPLTWTPGSDSVAFTSGGRIRIAPLTGVGSTNVDFTAPHRVGRAQGIRRPGFPEPAERRSALGILAPALSPSGDRIAFAALGDVWVADTSAGAPRRLARTTAADAHPVWSPDGRQVAHFSLGPRDSAAVWVRSVGEQASHRRIPLPRRLNFELDLAWDPEGERLAYSGMSLPAGNDFVVGVIDPENAEARTLARRRGAGGSLVGWGPDGRIVIWEREYDREAFWHRHRLARIDPGTGEIETGEVHDTLALRSAWTPDLGRVAFAVAGHGEWRSVVSPDSGGPVPDPAPESFSWSRDGRLLLYQSGARLRLLDVGTGASRTIPIELAYRTPPAPPPLLIQGVHVIDGTGTPRTEPRDVLVEGGHIAAVGAPGTLGDRHARRVDGTGLTLMPGLINLHAHLGHLGPPLTGFPYFGTTTVRDVGGSSYWMRWKAEQIETGAEVGPRLLYSGGLLQQEIGLDWQDLQVVDRADTSGIRGRISALVEMGASVLKIRIRDPSLERLATALAHDAGLPVTSHYVNPTTVPLGLEGKEHTEAYYREGQTAPYRQDLLALLEAGETCVTSTLMSGAHAPWLASRQDPNYRFPAGTMDSVAPFLAAESLAWLRRPIPAGFATRLRRRMETDQANVDAMVRSGVLVGAGTDAGPLDLRLDLELRLLVQAGLTPLQAIRIATFDAARCARIDDELGSVEPGKRADLLLVRGDPSTDIAALARIEAVILGGEMHPRSDLASQVGRSHRLVPNRRVRPLESRRQQP